MARIYVVDDSLSARRLLALRIREMGHEVHELADAESAADLAEKLRPDVVVTDLLMPGLSGVQLCRLLRGESATAHVPVVLLTASNDKRSRYWARSAGATAYIGKDRVEDVLETVKLLAAQSSAPSEEGPTRASRSLHERISNVLDEALFDSVLAGEVRALASTGEHTRLFEGLVKLATDVLTYRWLALLPARSYSPVFLHAHLDEASEAEKQARAALAIAAQRPVHVIGDSRAASSRNEGAPRVSPLVLGEIIVGTLAVAPASGRFTRPDERVLTILATELGAPLQMASLYEDAHRLASTDALTGLPNRRAFLDMLERERGRADRHALPVSLLMFDVDHFKRVNDTYGHAAGDAILRGVADVLRDAARSSDVVARLGGEEFVALLPHTGPDGARIAAERMRRALAEASHVCPGRAERLRVTASVGVVSALAQWSPEALLSAADGAMYLAKQRGRNRVEVASLKVA